MRGDAILYAHVLAAGFVLAVPAIGAFTYRRSQRRIAAGLRAKTRFLASLIPRQVAGIGLVCGLWWFGGVPAAALGLGAPRSWPLTIGLAIAVVGFLVWSSLRLRPRAAEIRKRLDARAGALIPDTPQERRWFVGVCVAGGIFEEMAFRGFLFFYVAMIFPGINGFEAAVVTSALFGFGHVYQGGKGMVATALSGLVLAVLYLVGGNVVLPAVTHIAGNMRALLIFAPSTAPSER